MTALYSISRSYFSACRSVLRPAIIKSAFDSQILPVIRFYSKAFSVPTIVRKDPVIMKLETENFKKLFTPELEALATVFNKYGYEIRIAGGAVRDLLMNKVPHDLDFASVATPDQMKEMFTKEQIRMINMKGETHGTVTARLNDKENFEITTLRIDTNTDGRHCEVQFTTDWLVDAGRRDLTINSMFLGLDGTVYDYFNGYEDLQRRRVVFVGNPRERIREDYLRILRYFRFYGRIAENPDAHDLSTIEAIEENKGGLAKISGERIWSELSKILEGNYGRNLLRLMIDIGLSQYIGLPSKPNVQQFEELCARCEKPLLPISLLVGLMDTEDNMMELHKRLKLSAFNRDLGIFLMTYRGGLVHEKPLLPYQKILLFTKFKTKDVRNWIEETLRYRGEFALEEEMRNWQLPRFPINGVMLRDLGVAGKQMSTVLNALKDYWADHDYQTSEDDLLKLVPDILKNSQPVQPKAK